VGGAGCGVPKAAEAEAAAAAEAIPVGATKAGNIHRIGGGTVENLRLKPAEEKLTPPGISVLKFDTPGEAAAAMRAAFPKAKGLHEAAKTVGSTTEEAIRSVGFDIIPDKTNTFPTHHRVIHPDGVAGFNDTNLAKLAEVFVNTTGH
jgi:hypothetical protein